MFSVKLDNKNSIEHCTKYHEVMPDEKFYNSMSETKSSAQIETNYGVFVSAGISIVYSHYLLSQVVRFMYNPVIRKCEFNQVVDEIWLVIRPLRVWFSILSTTVNEQERTVGKKCQLII